MRTTLVVAAVATAAFLLVSCAPKEPDLAGLKKAADGYNAASKSALMGGDLQQAPAYFSDDGLEMAPNMPMAKGREAIKAMWTQMMNSGMKFTAVNFTVLDVQAGGSIGHEYGTYEMTISAPDMGEMKDKGKTVTTWHQLADGSWKIVADIWNTDMPLPPMPKPNPKKK